jgi:hypothetical protein
MFVYFTFMTSVTLLHAEEIFMTPILQATTKCSLFRNNTTLLASPYRIQYPVSFSIFREVISTFGREYDQYNVDKLDRTSRIV